MSTATTLDHAAVADPVEDHGGAHHQTFWLWVMCLTAVDYMSTMGYFPSIGFEGLGKLLPLGTAAIVVLTLFGVLPLYCLVARESPHGEGSIKMIERLFAAGWISKIVVMILCGFAATDFILTITLSAADAAAHLIGNPLWEPILEWAVHPALVTGSILILLLGILPWRKGWSKTAYCLWGTGSTGIVLLVTSFLEKDIQQIVLTEVLIVLLGIVFWIGFKEAITLAVAIVGIYLVLNTIIIGACAVFLVSNPEYVQQWSQDIASGEWHNSHPMPLGNEGSSGKVFLTVIILFPLLALGLSGFETGVAVMRHVLGLKTDDPNRPAGRIRATRKLLVTAAIVMSIMLIGGSFAVATLIDPGAFHQGVEPTAKDRALAYIAHGQTNLPICPLFGPVFGTIYDLSTVKILWFAGASAFAGIMGLWPRYMPQFGMAPEWVAKEKPLVLAITAVSVVVTLIFRASVDAQGDAYATGVLALMASAGVAVALLFWSIRRNPVTIWQRIQWVSGFATFSVVAVALLYMFAFVVYMKPVGLQIATVFIVITLIIAAISRSWRSRELRFGGLRFKDNIARFLWDSLSGGRLVLVPKRPNGRGLELKNDEVRRRHRLGVDTEIVFLVVKRGDPSSFTNSPILNIRQEGGHMLIEAMDVASVSHTIAAIALELSRQSEVEVIFGWSEGGRIALAIALVLFGEGDIASNVRQLLQNAESDESRRPQVLIG